MATRPSSVVMGDVDLVRALGLAGISSVYVGPPDASARFSRHVASTVPWTDHWSDQEALVAALLALGGSEPEPLVLYPQTDATLLLASRHREELAPAFRFVLADAQLIEQLVDKARFQELAERHGLPVPTAIRVRAERGRRAPALDIAFPVIVKPLTRADEWNLAGGDGKALAAHDAAEWEAVWQRFQELGTQLLVQRLIPGPETAIESYHAYVDAAGEVAGEFTGRKIRTFPPSFGFSTAVEIVDLPDVAALGRDALARLGLRGVAKVDFKRDPDGELHLFEINPRFTLWHYPAALAGVNIPALVHADLTGQPRPAGRTATRVVSWCTPLTDLRAARAAGISPVSWLRWVRGCQAVSGLSRDDPLPFFRGAVWHAVTRRLPGVPRPGNA
jgi:predicted ATP-grasp superfamily ATP-dependent carboligase